MLVPGQCQLSFSFFPETFFLSGKTLYLPKSLVLTVPRIWMELTLCGKKEDKGTSGYCRKQLLLREYSPMAAIRSLLFPFPFHLTTPIPALQHLDAQQALVTAILPTGKHCPPGTTTMANSHETGQPGTDDAVQGDLGIAFSAMGDGKGCPGGYPFLNVH